MIALIILFIVFLYLYSSISALRNDLEDQRRSLESLRGLIRQALGNFEAAHTEQGEVPAPVQQATQREVESKPPEQPAQAPIAEPQPKQAETQEIKPVYVQKAIPIPEPVTISKTNDIPPPSNDLEAARAKPARVTEVTTPSGFTSEEVPFWSESVSSLYQRYLSDKNPIVLVGIFLLFLGASFLLSYAVRHGYLTVSPSMRCLAVAAAAAGLFWFGWLKRESHRTFGISLQGGAVAIWYLDLFVAHRLLGLLPSGLTFILLVALVAGSGALALLNNALTLALLGTIGGFLTPIVVSTGGGSHVELFSFYLVLDLGILALSYVRPWRVLNLVGFLFTFVIGLLWGAEFYRPSLFGSVEPFLIAFFLLYWMVPIISASRHKARPFGGYEAPILFGTPLIGFALQALLTADMRYGLAWTSAALVLLYLAGAVCALVSLKGEVKELKAPYLTLAVLFSILLVPLALSNHWTGLTWAAYAVVLHRSGKQSGSAALALAGRSLHFAASIAFGLAFSHLSQYHPVLNELFLGCAFLSAAAIVSVILEAPGESGALRRALLLGLGLVWWYLGGYSEIDRWLGVHVQFTALLLFGSASLLALDFLGARFSTAILRTAAQAQPLLLVILALRFADIDFRIFAHYALAAWLLSAVASYRLLFVEEREHGFPLIRHQLLFLSIMGLLAFELHRRMRFYVFAGSDWRVSLVPLFLGAVVLSFTLPREIRVWPFEGRLRAFRNTLLLPCLYLAWWLLAATANGGSMSARLYVPLLNPLDLVSIFVLIVLIVWATRVAAVAELFRSPNGVVITGTAAFLLMNVIVARAVHHWFYVPYTVGSLYDSSVLQTTYSVMWMMLSVALYALASRTKERVYWFGGAALSAVVVLKLFLVELARVGTIGRVVSFLCVGAIMVLIGYLFPLPPAEADTPGRETKRQ